MHLYEIPSRCRSGTPIKFRWYGEPQAKCGDDIEGLRAAFVNAIRRENRLLSEHLLATAWIEIHAKVERAIKGNLRSSSHLKQVDRYRLPAIFEIRWQDISILEIQPNGSLRQLNLLIRMYHSEPAEVPDYFIGHHIHEKVILKSTETTALQNDEIGLARQYLEQGRSKLWGINRLTGG